MKKKIKNNRILSIFLLFNMNALMVDAVLRNVCSTTTSKSDKSVSYDRPEVPGKTRVYLTPLKSYFKKIKLKIEGGKKK